MDMKTKLILVVGLLALQLPSKAQNQEIPSKWTLEQCINYAHENNITIKQQQLNVEANKNNLTQKKLNLAPSVNGSSSYRVGFGRSENREGNVVSIEDNTTQNLNLGIAADMPVLRGSPT